MLIKATGMIGEPSRVGAAPSRLEGTCWPPHLIPSGKVHSDHRAWQETMHSALKRSQQGLRCSRGLVCRCASPPSQVLAMPLCGNLRFHSAIFFHHLGFILFGLDFFQLISLVDLTHSPCTMSMKSRPASCPSRHICKYGPLSLHQGAHNSRLFSLETLSGICMSVHSPKTMLWLGVRVQ